MVLAELDTYRPVIEAPITQLIYFGQNAVHSQEEFEDMVSHIKRVLRILEIKQERLDSCADYYRSLAAKRDLREYKRQNASLLSCSIDPKKQISDPKIINFPLRRN